MKSAPGNHALSLDGQHRGVGESGKGESMIEILAEHPWESVHTLPRDARQSMKRMGSSGILEMSPGGRSEKARRIHFGEGGDSYHCGDRGGGGGGGR